jgi:signal peptidase II
MLQIRPVSSLVTYIAMTVSAALLVALDQGTKALAAAFLPPRGRVSLIGDLAILVFTRNRGAFLSLGSGLPPPLRAVFLVVLPLAALGFFAWAFLFRGLSPRGRQPGRGGRPRGRERAALVLIVAGGLGNLVDRILYGEVRDFLNFGIGRLRTGIMNLADLYILAALVIVAVAVVADRRRG